MSRRDLGRSRRGRWSLLGAGLLVLAVVASTAALAYAAGSASDRGEADAPAVEVTAAIERRVLDQRIELQGMVESGEHVLATAWIPAGAERSVVTATFVSAGDRIAHGQPLVEVSGRPIVAFTGVVPLYRSLQPHDSGPDVRWLQETLNRLGFKAVVDGRFGAATEAALQAWYQSIGYSPPAPEDERAAGVEAARESLARAEDTSRSLDAAADPRNMAQLRAEVGQAELAAGAWLSIEEVIIVPVGPSTIASVASAGSELEAGVDPVVAVQLGGPRVSVRATVAEVDSIEPGLEVGVEVPGSELALVGRVGDVGSFQPGDPERGVPPGHDVAISIQSAQEQAELEAGRAVRVVIEMSDARGPSLAVPVAAIREDTTGLFVQRVTSDRSDGRSSAEDVRVEIGIESDGWLEILNETETGLQEGDEVVLRR